jgi:transcriptional regulator with XRE-family HTH domain
MLSKSHQGVILTHRESQTPWQRVFNKFGLSQSELARAMGCHRSKISRALDDESGLINGHDQKAIINLAKDRGVPIDPADMVPEL